MEPSIKSLMKASEDQRLKDFGVTPEIIREFCVEKLRFGWKTQTRTTKNHATAYGKPDQRGVYKIKFNPLALGEWLRDYSPELFEIRMIDIMMHEISHILVRKFMGGRGHGWEWKLWGHLAGFVPFGSQSDHRRNTHAVMLHSQHRDGDRNVKVPASTRWKTPKSSPESWGGFILSPGLHDKWRISDRVEFLTKRGLIMQGTVIRVNRKSISVQVDGEEEGRYWRVSPNLLRRLESAVVDSSPRTKTEIEPLSGRPITYPDPDRPITIPDPDLDLDPNWAKDQRKPADLVRAGILAGLENPEIVKTLRDMFPDYKAYKIACSVYRRELRKKGEIA